MGLTRTSATAVTGEPVAAVAVRVLTRPVTALHLYVGLIGVLGLVVSAFTLWRNPPLADLLAHPHALGLLGLALVLGELKPIPVSRGDDTTSEITISTTFALALIVTGPLSFLLAIHTAAVLFDDLRSRRRPVQMFFNFGQYAITIVAARAVYCALSGTPFAGGFDGFGPDELVPALAAGFVFALLNDSFVAVVVAFDTGQSVWAMLRDDLTFKLETSGVLVALGPLAAVVVQISGWLLPLLALPVLAVRRSALLAVQRERQAFRDPLTGLANRELFRTRTERALAASAHSGAPVGVLMIDLDHFKDINDTLGHHIGDQLLLEVASRLEGAGLEGATVARLGGDEFAVLLPEMGEESEVCDVAEALLEQLSAPLELGATRLLVHASIGVAIGPEATGDVHGLMKHADIALYEAKRERACYSLYNSEEDTRTPQRLALTADLRDAVARGQMALDFQPQVDAVSGRVVAVEALIRWRHPGRGLVGPSEFIPLAENTGLIEPITAFVLEESLDAVAHWYSQGWDVGVAVNVSARHLSDLDLPRRVERALARRGVPPRLLTIEVTESSLMGDPHRAAAILTELRDLGVRLAIDDFGTGYSSLAHLKRLSVDELKIDRSFVTGSGDDANDEILVRSIADLGRNLGLVVVAEGVESILVADRLRAMGCSRLQGFLVGRPVPRHELELRLHREHQLAPTPPEPVRPVLSVAKPA